MKMGPKRALQRVFIKAYLKIYVTKLRLGKNLVHIQLTMLTILSDCSESGMYRNLNKQK